MSQTVVQSIVQTLANRFSIRLDSDFFASPTTSSLDSNDEANPGPANDRRCLVLIGNLLLAWDPTWSVSSAMANVFGMTPIPADVFSQTAFGDESIKTVSIRIRRYLNQIGIGYLAPAGRIDHPDKVVHLISSLVDKIETVHGPRLKSNILKLVNQRKNYARKLSKNRTARSSLTSSSGVGGRRGSSVSSLTSAANEAHDVSHFSEFCSPPPVGRQLPRTPFIRCIDDDTDQAESDQSMKMSHILPCRGRQIPRTPHQKDMMTRGEHERKGYLPNGGGHASTDSPIIVPADRMRKAGVVHSPILQPTRIIDLDQGVTNCHSSEAKHSPSTEIVGKESTHGDDDIVVESATLDNSATNESKTSNEDMNTKNGKENKCGLEKDEEHKARAKPRQIRSRKAKDAASSLCSDLTDDTCTPANKERITIAPRRAQRKNKAGQQKNVESNSCEIMVRTDEECASKDVSSPLPLAIGQKRKNARKNGNQTKDSSSRDTENTPIESQSTSLGDSHNTHKVERRKDGKCRMSVKNIDDCTNNDREVSNVNPIEDDGNIKKKKVKNVQEREKSVSIKAGKKIGKNMKTKQSSGKQDVVPTEPHPDRQDDTVQFNPESAVSNKDACPMSSPILTRVTRSTARQLEKTDVGENLQIMTRDDDTKVRSKARKGQLRRKPLAEVSQVQLANVTLSASSSVVERESLQHMGCQFLLQNRANLLKCDLKFRLRYHQATDLLTKVISPSAKCRIADEMVDTPAALAAISVADYGVVSSSSTANETQSQSDRVGSGQAKMDGLEANLPTTNRHRSRRNGNVRAGGGGLVRDEFYCTPRV